MSVSAKRRIPISKVVIDDEQIEAVVTVLKSGNLREGPECRAFEVEFAQYVGAAHALTASSGTAAIHMAYLALLEPEDEVLVPSFTFFATASMVAAVGAVPVFCDVDPETWTLDLADAARRITPRTRAVAPVHIFGNPVDADSVLALAKAHGLSVIWDAAQAHGAEWQNHDVGSLPGISCYSFYPSKNMTTGEGGMICTDDDSMATKLRLLRSQGQTERYLHPVIGYNFRMTDIQAAIGRGQLRHLAKWTETRRANASYLRSRLDRSPLLTVQKEQDGGKHSYHQFSVIVDESVDRDALVTALVDSGIDCGVYYPIPQHLQPAFARFSRESLSATELVSQRVLSVPIHPHLSSGDLQFIADRLLELSGSGLRGSRSARN